MSWLQLKILTAADNAATVETWLEAEGALAITLLDAKDEPIFEPDLGTTPLWQLTLVTGLFTNTPEADQLTERLQIQWAVHFPEQPLPAIKLEILENQDWIQAGLKDLKPLEITENFWVVPSWLDAPNPAAVNLQLNPGLAFGTGYHPTTFLCLEFLASIHLQDKVLIDYGCGSGILGLAGLKLGAKQAIGVDIDPQALEASQQNAKLNQLNPELFPVYYPDDLPKQTCQVMVANILAGPLIKLAPQLAELVEPHGQIALSGILQRQEDEVKQAFSPWFDFLPTKEQEGWVLLSAERRN